VLEDLVIRQTHLRLGEVLAEVDALAAKTLLQRLL
jgi:hypothetical protein